MKKKHDFKNAQRGAVVQQKGKTPITIYIDTDILDEFRNLADGAGSGYQTMINEALSLDLGKAPKPVDETVLRQVLRQELKRAAHD